MPDHSPILVYKALLEAIKIRVKLLERFAQKSVSVGDPRHDWEIVALQLRMTLELIAFSSLC